MMPARLAATPIEQRIPEPIGSGPFRFVKSEWRPGNTMLLERNPDYVPRKEAPDFLAGGKNVKIDQLVLRVMPDPSTGANALIAGEVDYMQYLPFDMLPVLEKEKALRFIGLGGIHQFQGNFRLNHAAPPFDNPNVRQVLWRLVDQDATLTAIGVPEKYRTKSCPSYFMCGAPLSTEAGAAGHKFDLAAAREELKASGYKGEPVLIMSPTDSPPFAQLAHVAHGLFREVGLNIQSQITDWGTVTQRRQSRAELDKGGWSVFPSGFPSVDYGDPVIGGAINGERVFVLDARTQPLGIATCLGRFVVRCLRRMPGACGQLQDQDTHAVLRPISRPARAVSGIATSRQGWRGVDGL